MKQFSLCLTNSAAVGIQLALHWDGFHLPHAPMLALELLLQEKTLSPHLQESFSEIIKLVLCWLFPPLPLILIMLWKILVLVLLRIHLVQITGVAFPGTLGHPGKEISLGKSLLFFSYIPVPPPPSFHVCVSLTQTHTKNKKGGKKRQKSFEGLNLRCELLELLLPFLF